MPVAYDASSSHVDTDRERAILSALAADVLDWWKIHDALPTEAFASEDHRQLYAAMGDAASWSRPVPTIPTDWLPSTDLASDAAALTRLYLLRRFLATIPGRIAEAHQPDADITAIIDRTRSDIETITNYHAGLSANVLTPADALIVDVLAEAQRRVIHREETGSDVMGLETGFRPLDTYINGLDVGLIVLGGAPGAGKTTFANQLSATIAGNGTPVLYLTFENSRANLILKSICRVARVKSADADRGRADMAKLRDAAQVFAPAASRLYYLEAGTELTLTTVKARAQQAMHRHQTDRCLIVVDYLQKLAHSGGYDELRANVSRVAADLRELSRTLNSPVLALASVNRDAYKSENGKIGMAHLKESGDIEFAADVVLTLAEESDRTPPFGCKALTLKVAKNRNGGTGIVPLDFHEEIADFRLAELHSPVIAGRPNGSHER